MTKQENYDLFLANVRLVREWLERIAQRADPDHPEAVYLDVILNIVFTQINNNWQRQKLLNDVGTTFNLPPPVLKDEDKDEIPF